MPDEKHDMYMILRTLNRVIYSCNGKLNEKWLEHLSTLNHRCTYNYSEAEDLNNFGSRRIFV